ncbi:hypothetical protein NA57DRAFT_62250 [Rhizodiscina lignyota]|uniref:Uncharacterized protein n=1 Tax=Rhizodiscina lignyota TaxID=1504668 RepID=A0A9P4M2X5_9PEZI|nr:hypothetical protein NA57DRAFT_62250 [Rhizodiscina lignyota]
MEGFADPEEIQRSLDSQLGIERPLHWGRDAFELVLRHEEVLQTYIDPTNIIQLKYAILKTIDRSKKSYNAFIKAVTEDVPLDLRKRWKDASQRVESERVKVISTASQDSYGPDDDKLFDDFIGFDEAFPEPFQSTNDKDSEYDSNYGSSISSTAAEDKDSSSSVSSTESRNSPTKRKRSSKEQTISRGRDPSPQTVTIDLSNVTALGENSKYIQLAYCTNCGKHFDPDKPVLDECRYHPYKAELDKRTAYMKEYNTGMHDDYVKKHGMPPYAHHHPCCEKPMGGRGCVAGYHVPRLWMKIYIGGDCDEKQTSFCKSCVSLGPENLNIPELKVLKRLERRMTPFEKLPDKTQDQRVTSELIRTPHNKVDKTISAAVRLGDRPRANPDRAIHTSNNKIPTPPASSPPKRSGGKRKWADSNRATDQNTPSSSGSTAKSVDKDMRAGSIYSIRPEQHKVLSTPAPAKQSGEKRRRTDSEQSIHAEEKRAPAKRLIDNLKSVNSETSKRRETTGVTSSSRPTGGSAREFKTPQAQHSLPLVSSGGRSIVSTIEAGPSSNRSVGTSVKQTTTPSAAYPVGNTARVFKTPQVQRTLSLTSSSDRSNTSTAVAGPSSNHSKGPSAGQVRQQTLPFTTVRQSSNVATPYQGKGKRKAGF